jgi:hypothetical protein
MQSHIEGKLSLKLTVAPWRVTVVASYHSVCVTGGRQIVFP